ncbi:hypothetical protein WOLCODRAFT_145239 [Wolfiporia cocos MD-104 SS10]|uniref:Uncharacterized protein n=1 Tax=Wolfiporia cocos (strain MD-104) TaxID=742152 RepID=A0A2H3K420_WOLCO|nr:hypothetical protein WOLCODRAFT_145239 [Wolfiporia cocos MD-104 SS10]
MVAIAGFLAVLILYIVSKSKHTSIFCVSGGRRCWNLLIFLSTNFFAHAASVPSISGGGDLMNCMSTLLAVFLPFTGLGYSLRLLSSYILLHGNKMQEAMAPGALAVVCRTSQWEPLSQEDLVYIRIPDSYDFFGISSSDLHYASFYLVPGVGKATINSLWTMDLIKQEVQITDSQRISRSRSWLPTFISLFQLLSATITLIGSVEQETAKYGSAAYSFTIVPFIVMSVVNLVAIGCCGDYSYLYVLTTSISREAPKRPGAIIDGTIGRFVHVNPSDCVHYSPVSRASSADLSSTAPVFSIKTWLYSKMRHVKHTFLDALSDLLIPAKLWRLFIPVIDDGQTRLARLSTEPFHNETEKILKVTIDGVTRRFALSTPGNPTPHIRIGIGSITSDIPLPLDSRKHTTKERIIAFSIFFLGCLAGVVPYIVIQLLSGLIAHSTVSQRFWAMAWLAVE